jgi:alpha-tubulin suppressor-like RCC1 family protein
MKAKSLPLKGILCLVLLVFYFLFTSLSVYCQSETHNMTTYDTIIPYRGSGSASQNWVVRITRPVNFFTAGSADTASRPVIMTMQGDGEVSGGNYTFQNHYGPHYLLANGWDGSVVLGNGTHYPVLITVQQNVANTRPNLFQSLFDTLYKEFHPRSLHYGGLSGGVEVGGWLLGYQATAGDEHIMARIQSFCNFSGVAPSDVENMLGAQPMAYPNLWGYWAHKYHGRYFGAVGDNDNQTSPYLIEQMINDSVPGAAYFSWVNTGGGAHCCWNSDYDNTQPNWTNTAAPFGNSLIVSLGSPANTAGDYVYNPATGTNVLQWMLRQGDTTLVTGTATPPSTTPPTVSAGSAQTVQLPTSTVSLAGTASASSPTTIASTVWTITSGPTGAAITTPNSLTTTVTSLSAGTYIFTLTVKDNTGLVSTSTVTITVNAAATTPPAVSAGSTQTVQLPTSTVNLSGTASAAAPNTLASTVWTITSGPSGATISTPNSLATAVTGLSAGTYVFTLTAKDNTGLVSTSTVTITVNAAVTPPTTTPTPPVNPYASQPTIVGAGEYQCFFLDQNRHLYGIGDNYAFLGTNNAGTKGLAIPVVVSPSNLTFQSVAGGLHGGAAVDVNGNVWTIGDNAYGELGNGTTTALATAYEITVDSLGNPFNNVSQVFCYFTGNAEDQGDYAVKNDGTLWVWGYTGEGMRGNGTAGGLNTRPVQVPIPGGRSVKQIVAGQVLIVLCTDGTVWTCGAGNGQLQNLGYAGATATSSLSLTQVTTLSNITQIAGGTAFNYALTSTGTLYGWGVNSSYMGYTATQGSGTPLATPTVLTNIMNGLPHPIKQIVVNTECTHVILSDGSLWGWGDNAMGTVGIGTELNFATTTAPYAWDFLVGDKLVQLPVRIVPSRSDFTAIFGSSVFTFYTYAETADGTLYSWGRNKGCVLGNGVISCSPNITATYPDSWDVTTPTIVAPMALTATTIVACPYCLLHPGSSPCSDCAYPVVIPVANAGSNITITLPVNTTTLDGSGSSNPGGGTLTYAWVQVSGPSTSTIVTASGATTTVSGLVQGTYTYQLTVTNTSGVTATATVTVTVNAAVPPVVTPIANAGANSTITLPVSTAILDGNSSSNPGGGTLTYAWIQVSGPSTSTITTASGATTTVTGLVQGTYTYQLTVTNSQGKTATATVTVTVNAAAPVGTPVANAGANITITLPVSTATLNGSASYDPGGSTLTYAWVQQSGPTTSTITTVSGATTTVTGLAQGTYTYQLTVTNTSAVTATATVTVTVNAAPVVVTPVADAGANITVTLPISTATLDGSASSNPGGGTLTYAWTQTSGPSTSDITSPDAMTTVVTGLVQGTYTYQLTVTNSTGVSATATVTVTVNAAVTGTPVPPVAVAGSNMTVYMPASSVQLNGSASYDATGTIVSYDWVQVSGSAGITITNSNTATPNIDDLSPGTYTFELTVTNNAGETSTSQVTVTVMNQVASPLIANAGQDTVISLPASAAVLNGTASTDQGGIIESYQWTQLSGPATSQMESASLAVCPIDGLKAGTYIFLLTVTDNQGNTATDSVTVSVISNERSSASNQALLYPNPTESMSDLHIQSTTNGTVVVKVYDVMGGVVSTIVTDKQSPTIDMQINSSALSRGMYVLSIQIGGKVWGQVQMIKQ